MAVSRISCSGLAALLVAAGSAAALSGAWYFQLVVGLAPCPLCLEQRLPYYVAVPFGIVVALLAARRASRPLVITGLIVLALLMAASGGLGIYHAGIEWAWWQGPTACSGGAPAAVTDVMAALRGARVARCDEAAWRLFGISLAGWNVAVAGVLLVVALAGVKAACRSQGSSSVSQ